MASPITPKLIYNLTMVSGPALSPDGNTLVFAKSAVDESTMEGCSQLMKMSLPSGDTQPFTQGPKDANPRYSPDGKHIAFLRSDDKEKRQIWSIPTNGGEARQITTVPGGVSVFQWSPDCQTLAFVGRVDPDQLPDDHDPKLDPQVKVITRLRYRFDTLGWIGNSHTYIFTIGLNDDEAKQLTSGDWDDSYPAWSPDGKSIAFVSDREPDRETTFRCQAYVMPASGGEPVMWSDGLSSVNNPTWSPDGKQLLVIASNDDEVAVWWSGEFHIIEPGKAPERLHDDSIHPNSGFGPIVPAPDVRWLEDGRIIFQGDAQGEAFLFELNSTDKSLKTITKGGEMFAGLTFDAQTQKAVIMAMPPTSAGDLFTVDVGSGERQQLTEYNKEYFAEHPTATMEKFTLERAGMEIQSRLLLPPGFDASKKYPMILEVHGGPHGAFYDAFNPMQQVMATAGYVVLCVNPRGSSSYGKDFGKAVLADWGGEDYLDLIQAVDEVISRGYIDENRLGIHGYSYGGFMSSWAIGQTTRFKSAVIGAPCIDLPSFAGTADIGINFGEIQWGGRRHENLDAYIKHSPITYAPNVETPALLLHGEADHRCPIEQSEQYFVALKRMDKTVEFVRFPGCSHLFLRFAHPKLREEYLTRMKAWHDRHLMGAGVEAEASEAVSV